MYRIYYIGKGAERGGVGEEYYFDNVAGILSYTRQKRSLKNENNTKRISYQHWYEWDISSFKNNNEYSYQSYATTIKKLPIDDVLSKMMNDSSLPTRSLEPGKYPVFISASGMAQIIQTMFYSGHFSGKSLREEIGPLYNFFEKKWVNEKITISDGPAPHRPHNNWFDRLGNKREPYAIIKNGHFVGPLYSDLDRDHFKDCYYAHNSELITHDPFPIDLEIAGTDFSDEDLLKKLQNGIYITDLHYLSLSDSQNLGIYGLTRGGVYVIQNGEKVAQVNNMRFELQVQSFLNSIIELGKTSDIQSWGQVVKSPSVILKNFHFTQKATNI